tara:strand:+ start:116 stop:553 length:438 start_codon:yes stop_codon:yes gene_type:complete
MEKILNSINIKYLWFTPTQNKKLSLISQGKTQDEVKEKFKNKIELKADKYINKDIIIAKLIKIKKPNSIERGPIGIVIKFKKVNSKNKIKNVRDNEKNNVVWFTKDYLLEHGFDPQNIVKLLTAVYFDKIKLSKLGLHEFDDLKL